MDRLWVGQIVGKEEGPLLAREGKEDFLEEARQEQVIFKLPYTARELTCCGSELHGSF